MTVVKIVLLWELDTRAVDTRAGDAKAVDTRAGDAKVVDTRAGDAITLRQWTLGRETLLR